MSGTLFGMGLPEIVAIAILTLLVFGPDRLPGLMRDFGRTVRKMREVYASLSTELQKELGPYAKEIDEATRDLRKDLNSIREVTDVRNLIPPLTLESTEAPKAEAPKAENLQTIGGVAMSPVNDTPMSFPPFDPKPESAGQAAEEAVSPPPADGGAAPAASAPAPAPPAENSIAPPQTPAAVALSDDNPWKL